VYRDDGAGGPIQTEVNQANDPLVRNLPSLNQLTVTSFPSGSQGRTFRFQIKVVTTQRDAISSISFIELASVPFKPVDKPISDSLVTSDDTIKVSFADPKPENGGSPIISYELVMDDGMSGNFTTLVGLDANSLLT
jgi:hypothetical protein